MRRRPLPGLCRLATGYGRAGNDVRPDLIRQVPASVFGSQPQREVMHPRLDLPLPPGRDGQHAGGAYRRVQPAGLTPEVEPTGRVGSGWRATPVAQAFTRPYGVPTCG
jgi:hypothetical protein